MSNEAYKPVEDKMKKTISVLKEELAGLRAGRRGDGAGPCRGNRRRVARPSVRSDNINGAVLHECLEVQRLKRVGDQREPVSDAMGEVLDQLVSFEVRPDEPVTCPPKTGPPEMVDSGEI